MKSVRIAGVSVNAKSLPTEAQLIAEAKKTPEYRENKNADKEIKAEIRKSGLYPTNATGATASHKPTKH